MSIDKIRNIGLDKLVTQVYDFDSLTTDELMCKFAQKINIIIEHLKYIDDRCYNSDKAIELKLQYLLGQGLEEQVAKKLIEFYNNGKLAELINETLLKDINDKVDSLKVETNNVKVDFNNFKTATDNNLSQIETRLTYNDKFIYSNWGTMFDNKIAHNSWTHGTTFFDSNNDVVVVAYNSKDKHAVNNASVYLRYMNKNYEWSKEIVVKLKSEKGALCHTAFSLNGKWYFIIQTINEDNTTEKIELYTTINLGETWVISDINGFNLADIYAGDIYGNFIDNGKLFVTCYNNNTLKSCIYYSTDFINFNKSEWLSSGETNITEPMFIKDQNSGRIACFARYGVDDRYNITIAAKYFYSDDDGLTWSLPVDSNAIKFMNNNNGTILDVGNGNCEIIWGNRRSLGWSEIWHGNCRISDLVLDKPFNSNIVCTFNKITGSGTNLGDGGYVGACIKNNGEIVGSYYTGTKSSANICIFMGSRGALRSCPWEVDPTNGWSRIKKSNSENYIITGYNTVIYSDYVDIPIQQDTDKGIKIVSLDLDKIPWKPFRLLRATVVPTKNTTTNWDYPKFCCGLNSYDPDNNSYEIYVRTTSTLSSDSIARVWLSLELA